MAMPGHAVRREPFVRQPEVRAKRRQAARLELLVRARRAGRLNGASLDGHAELGHSQVEQALVRPGGPLVRGDRLRRHHRLVRPSSLYARRPARRTWARCACCGIPLSLSTGPTVTWRPDGPAPQEHSYEVCQPTSVRGPADAGERIRRLRAAAATAARAAAGDAACRAAARRADAGAESRRTAEVRGRRSSCPRRRPRKS